MSIRKRSVIVLWVVLFASLIGAIALPRIGLTLSRQRLAEYFDARTKASFNDEHRIEASKIDDDEKSARASGAHYLGDVEKINEPMLIAKVLANGCVMLALLSGGTLVYRRLKPERTVLAAAPFESGDRTNVGPPSKASLAYWIVPIVCLVPTGTAAFLLPIWREMFAGFGSPYPAFTAFLEQGRYWLLGASLFLALLPFAVLRKRELPREKRTMFRLSTLVAVVLGIAVTVALILPVIDLVSNLPEKSDPAGPAQETPKVSV